MTIDINAGGICGAGVFAYGAQMQTGTGAVNDKGRDEGDGNGQIYKKAVIQHKIAEYAQLACDGQSLFETVGGGGQSQKRHIRAGKLYKRTAEEVAEAHAEGGHSKTGDILICSEGHSKETEKKSHQKRADQTKKRRDQHGQRGIQSIGRGKALLIKESADHAADAAHIHDTGNTEVHVAGFLGNDFAGGSV